MKLRFAGMTVALAVGITAAVVLACSIAAYIYSTYHYRALLETARAAALAEGELIRVALEHQMIENDRGLIARMVESFGRQPRIERVALLDRQGIERYSAGRQETRAEVNIESRTCQACHRLPPDRRSSSHVIEMRGGAVLRTVVPIRNRPECHRCHAPAHRVNGILLVDYSAGETRAAMTRDLRWMVAGAAAMTLLLVGTIAVIVYLAVVRRLRRFEIVARQIAAGDLERRVPAKGSDTLAWLAREFNIMADSVTGLAAGVRNERERLETVINSIDDGIVVLDPQRTIIAANEAFLRRAGRSRSQLVGNCCCDLPPGACAIADCPSAASLRSGAGQVRICERRTLEGAAAWDEVHASPILDSCGKLTHVVEVWRDISERRAAEARLAESHRLASLGMLASGFSHELNTPLATVLMCVEGILREVPGEGGDVVDWPRISDNASIAREQILRCRGITQHFLRLSRGHASAAGVVDVRAAVDAVVRLVEPTARAHSVPVRVVSIAPDLRVCAGEAELQHTLINLLLNAIQASKPGGHVLVSAEADESVHIRVMDEGCGIGAENLDRIFEPFFSLRNGGTGLGLFLSLNFVRRWSGDILVQSAVGKGSTFEVRLPSAADALAREAAR
jgi:PAS domain S-box-containing protein